MPSLQECAKLPPHLLANARLLPERYDILPLLPKDSIIAEVGVALGDFSDTILRICEPRHFIAIDIFTIHEMEMLWGKPTAELFGRRTHEAYYLDRFAAPVADGRMTVLKHDSVAALETLADRSVDVFYVDADHSYASVAGELAVIKRKIHDDGVIILNDYIMNEAGYSNAPYGVIQAVHEFMIAENWEMIYLALQSCMYCDVVLRRAGSGRALPGAERIEDLERQNAALREALALTRASTSWRATAPLRALRERLRPTTVR